jgi:hypothetical protein
MPKTAVVPVESMKPDMVKQTAQVKAADAKAKDGEAKSKAAPAPEKKD